LLIGTTTLSLDENQGDEVTPKFRWSGFMLCLVSPRQRLRATNRSSRPTLCHGFCKRRKNRATT